MNNIKIENFIKNEKEKFKKLHNRQPNIKEFENIIKQIDNKEISNEKILEKFVSLHNYENIKYSDRINHTFFYIICNNCTLKCKMSDNEYPSYYFKDDDEVYEYDNLNCNQIIIKKLLE